jgi:2-amino-4-hydroxy-6-hydroxymethyldihydropteridine diphosphokinase
MMNKAVIALGSNIEPEENIEKALHKLSHMFNLLQKSGFVFTEPVGYKNQPDFLNGSVLIKTPFGKEDLIKALKKIEVQLGRTKRAHKNGPRKIDLDLIVFNGCIVDDEVLKRDFLKASLLKLLPDFQLGKR